MGEETNGRARTILFLCKCAGNISNSVDFEKIKKWSRQRGGITSIVTGNLLCSPKEKIAFANIIKKGPIKSIIVAACSPKLHEKTFQEIGEEQGVNISRVQMANIREQCAWVTEDPEYAVEKAIKIINAAIERSKYSENLEKPTMKVNPDVLVIGGGIAGINAAQTLSKTGRKVYLVEREISVGGSLIKIEEVAPNMECSPCMLAPLLSDVRDDPNIEIITNAEVTEVKGFFGNFTARVTKKPRYIEESCIGCEECFEVCPVSVKNDFHLGLGERKAVYTLFPGSVPAAAAISREECRHFSDEACSECVAACAFESINFDQQEEELSIEIGAIVLATGFKTGELNDFPNLGSGRLDNVYTTPEFERLASSNGPTGGHISLKNGEAASSIAVIHCAGSMSKESIPYCSGVCCTNALKVGELAREKNPETEVYNIHNDLVFSTPGEFSFYKKQEEAGTNFIKCGDLSSITIEKSAADGKITVKMDQAEPIEVDMVVLSTGLLPAKGTAELAEILNLDFDENGFFIADHEILNPTGSVLDGIYIAGCAAGPTAVPGSITRAKAAAGDILSRLIPGQEIELEIMTSVIDEEICSGCKLCIAVCPYKAILFDSYKKVSRINEAICRGCGTCTAACPGGASKAKHFTDDQIYAEIGGLLHA